MFVHVIKLSNILKPSNKYFSQQIKAEKDVSNFEEIMQDIRKQAIWRNEGAAVETLVQVQTHCVNINWELPFHFHRNPMRNLCSKKYTRILYQGLYGNSSMVKWDETRLNGTRYYNCAIQGAWWGIQKLNIIGGKNIRGKISLALISIWLQLGIGNDYETMEN